MTKSIYYVLQSLDGGSRPTVKVWSTFTFAVTTGPAGAAMKAIHSNTASILFFISRIFKILVKLSGSFLNSDP